MEFVWVPIIVSQITRAIKYTTTNLLWSTLFWKILKLELINRNFFTSFYMQCFSFQSYVFNISLTYNVLIRSNPELEFQTYQKNPHKFSCHMVGIFWMKNCLCQHFLTYSVINWKNLQSCAKKYRKLVCME